MKGGVDSDYNDNVRDDSVDVIAARSLCIIVFFLFYNSTFSVESQIIFLTFNKLIIWHTPNSPLEFIHSIIECNFWGNKYSSLYKFYHLISKLIMT